METNEIEGITDEPEYQSLTKAIQEIKEIYNVSKRKLRNEKIMKTEEESMVLDWKINGSKLVEMVNKTSTKDKCTTIIYIAIENYVPQLRPFLESLIKSYPELISLPRKDEKYYGHTAFHLAVCKNYTELAKKMLDKVGDVDKEKLFKECATGSNFEQTVMLGELPLFTAALSLNKEMFEGLLNKGANLYERNSKGDDIYHALIRYAHYYPNKEDEVIELLKLIQTEDETKQNATKADVENADTTNDISKTVKPADKITLEDQTKDTSKAPKPGILWSMKNHSGLNPLELATKSGLCKIFGMIYNSEPYFIEHGNDGLNDIKTYDITDLDPVVLSDACNDFADSGSILQFLFQIHPSLAFPFIRTPQVSKIIEVKWKYYRWIVYIWFILHLVFMSFLTWYATERSEQNTNDEEGFNVNASPSFRNKVFSKPTVTVFAFVSLIWGILYVSPEINKLAKYGIPCKRKGIGPERNEERLQSYFGTIWKWIKTTKLNPYSNGSYRSLMALFSISLILDSCFALAVGINQDFKYEQYCLYVSVVIGWLFVIFFLRVFKYFSFFGILLQKVIFGDVIRFIFFFLFIIFGFGTAMFMAIQGSPATDESEYSTYGRTLLSMIKLIGGVGESPSFYETRHPGICVAIFLMYIAMTSVVILNALIAMMGTTCSELVGNVGNKNPHDRYWKLERLSVILFFEGIFPEKWIKRVGNTPKGTRRHLEIRSLIDLDSNEIIDEREDTQTEVTTKDLPRQKMHQNATMDIYHINQCEHYKPYGIIRTPLICPQDPDK